MNDSPRSVARSAPNFSYKKEWYNPTSCAPGDAKGNRRRNACLNAAGLRDLPTHGRGGELGRWMDPNLHDEIGPAR